MHRETLGRLADIMRIFSALLIFYYHAGLFVTLPFSRYGDFAVNTFIVLAIVAGMAFTRADQQPSFAAYVWRRIKRIFPLYLTINLLIFAASFVYPSRMGQPFTIRQLVLSSSGLSIALGDRFLSEVFWFIPFIFQVYVLLGWCGNRLLRLNWPAFFIIAFIISAVEITWLSRVMGDTLIETRKWSPLLRLPEMLFGVMTAALIAKVVPARRYLANAGTYAFFALALACGAFAIPNASYLFALPLLGLAMTSVVTGFGAVVLAGLDCAAVSTGTLRFLGRATFPFFLIHGIGMRFVHSRWHGQALPWLGYLAACLLGACVLELIFGLRLKPLPQRTQR